MYEYLGKGKGMRTSWYHMKSTHSRAVAQRKKPSSLTENLKEHFSRTWEGDSFHNPVISIYSKRLKGPDVSFQQGSYLGQYLEPTVVIELDSAGMQDPQLYLHL